jgi:hypothetical protein
MPFREDSYKKLEQHLAIPSEFKLALIGTIGRAFKFGSLPNSGNKHFTPTECQDLLPFFSMGNTNTTTRFCVQIRCTGYELLSNSLQL